MSSPMKASSTSTSLEAIVFDRRDGLRILDQLLLPQRHEYVTVRDSADGFTVIKEMKVRGAPAIGIVAALSLAAELINPSATEVFAARKAGDLDGLKSAVLGACAKLRTARPTAVNLMKACDDIKGETNSKNKNSKKNKPKTLLDRKSREENEPKNVFVI